MVSSVLGMSAEELLEKLQELREQYAGDPEYAALRSQLPAEWPI
jgi:hypothetical protein